MFARNLCKVIPRVHFTPTRGLPLSCSGFDALKIQKVQADDQRGLLRIKWEDGIEGRYPYVWLQDCAPPAGDWGQNYLGTDPRPLPMLAELNLKAKPEHVEVLPVGQGILVQWPVYNQVNYPSSWLRQHFRASESEWMNAEKIWDRKLLTDMGGIPTFTAGVNIANYFTKMKESIKEVGVIRVRYGMVMLEHILEGIGINIQQDKVPLNAKCYAKQANDLHTGVPFYNPVPKLATLGFFGKPKYGQLQMVDGFMVAKKIRTNHPFAFRYLSATQITYTNLDRRYELDPNHFENLVTRKNQEPVFVLKENGYVDRVVFSNPCRSSQQDLPPNTMPEFYAALKLFNSYCYDSKNVTNVHPEADDLMIFANDRILHGTTAFDGDPKSVEISEGFYHWNNQ